MKKMTLISLLMVCMPFWVMAQSSNDDLYFIPKKKTEKKTVEKKTTTVVVSDDEKSTAVYATPGTTIVVKDAKGNTRDVDEYNRRYTSRDNTFTMENDTLYIEEKPMYERGEWVNGFEGSQDDYEYAMRIVRFRNPRFAIPVSSPLYWDVVYALPSWDWNVYDDGLYAYVFPSYTNRLWWDWRFDYSWRWNRPWYYGSWHSPYWFGGGYWGGHWGGYWGAHWGHHHHWHSHHMPHFAWGGYWGKPHGWHGSSARNPGIHAGRYANNLRSGVGVAGNANRRYATTQRNNHDNNAGVKQSGRTDRNAYRNGTTVRNSSGRVVTSKDGSNSVGPQRTAVRNRNGETTVTREASRSRTQSTYTRPAQGRSSSYNRPSSTRKSVTNTTPSYQRKGNATAGSTYRSSSARRSNDNSSYRSSSSRSSSRSSFSSGGGSSSRSSMGGGSSRGGGGGSRGGGGRR